MKSFTKILVTIACFFITSCSTNGQLTQFNDGKYYGIMPDNFILLMEKKSDSVFTTTLRPFDNYAQHGWETYIKIHKTDLHGKTNYFYVESWNSSKAKHSFYAASFTLLDKDRFALVRDTTSYKSLAACLNSKMNLNADENFYFTFYTPPAIDSFKKFKLLTSLDNNEICVLIDSIKAEARRNEEKIKNIARYDMYLSGSTKEIVTRALIKLKINPIDYTSEESNHVLSKCVN